MRNHLAQAIQNQAFALGYERCGIVPLDRMEGYTDRLSERIDRFPETREDLSWLYGFGDLQTAFPWAKSIVICARRYGKYKIPVHLEGLIAKSYLTDGRRDVRSPDYRDSVAFEQSLSGLGLRTATDRDFGITAVRWAAMQAGLGIVRKNNFFYTERGSCIHLEAWLIDLELTLVQTHSAKPCPPACDRCVQACPTGSLCGPYAMNRSSCVSCLTTWDGWDYPTETHRRGMGGWIYGCDLCQDACPFNRGTWTGEVEFPGLRELGERISLEQVLEMDYDFLRDVIQPKFWYIPKESVWKWKTNALNAMINCYTPAYRPAIERAGADPDPRVRRMADWILSGSHTADENGL